MRTLGISNNILSEINIYRTYIDENTCLLTNYHSYKKDARGAENINYFVKLKSIVKSS